MRQDVTFMSEGLKCAGWLYLPDDLRSGEKRPTLVMAHGFSAVKEMYLDSFAEVFVAAGFVTLVFDYRYQGASEGESGIGLFPLNSTRTTATPSPGSPSDQKWMPHALACGDPPTVERTYCILPLSISALKRQ